MTTEFSVRRCSSLSSWLRENEPEATRRYNRSLPRREELSRLKKELCLRFDLADIRYPRQRRRAAAP